MLSTAATPSSPGVLWYVSRGSGIAALVLLAVVVGLGIAASCRWRTEGWPRFLTTGVHRSLSWTLAGVLGVHIVTASIDSFAGISLRDAVVPFVTRYRTAWMGLGTLAFDIGAVVLLSTVALRRIGYRTWRVVHWLGYACFPLAVLHGLATGSDTRSDWDVLLGVVLLFGVVGLVAWRVVADWPDQGIARAVGVLLLGAGALVAAFWVQAGPLSAGWARASGTPPELLGPGPDAGFAELLPAGSDDAVTGSLQSAAGPAPELDLVDSRNGDLTVVLVTSESASGAPPAAGVLEVRNGPLVICSSPASIGADIEAVCGGQALTLRVRGSEPELITGELLVGPARTSTR